MAKAIGRKLRKFDRGCELPLEGTVLNQVIVDAAVTLRFTSDQFISSIRIEQEFTLQSGSQLVKLASSRPSELGPLLSLINADVISAQGFERGDLFVLFAGGERLLVPSHPKFEAWEFESSLGARVVSIPGGALTIWSDLSDKEGLKH